ncbi:histidine phosphatase family protein [Undibacterium sp. TJN19]|uniref:histidine phosphatase family protein n=1 Tax=Undibacterium sp. TJN19 TaxID=3413055 RepID=UPI003BF18B52
MLLHLLRHTRPLIGSGICYGQSDIAVSETDCMQLAMDVQPQLNVGIPVFSSPLQRCAQLARQFSDVPVFDARLKELNFGNWEMQEWDHIPRAEIDAWALAQATYRPGGAESAVEFAQRIILWLEDLRLQQIPEALIVSHAGSMRMILAWENGMQAQELAEKTCQRQQNFAFGEYVKYIVFR